MWLTVSRTKLMYFSSCVCTLCIICKQAKLQLLKSTHNYSLQKCDASSRWVISLMCPFIPKHPKVEYKIICFHCKGWSREIRKACDANTELSIKKKQSLWSQWYQKFSQMSTTGRYDGIYQNSMEETVPADTASAFFFHLQNQLTDRSSEVF